jgi:hypothetical protein
MRLLEGAARLQNVPDGLPHRQGPAPIHLVGQIGSFEELHH